MPLFHNKHKKHLDTNINHSNKCFIASEVFRNIISNKSVKCISIYSVEFYSKWFYPLQTETQKLCPFDTNKMNAKNRIIKIKTNSQHLYYTVEWLACILFNSQRANDFPSLFPWFFPFIFVQSLLPLCILHCVRMYACKQTIKQINKLKQSLN